jgi:hypothetical protein
LVEVSTLGYTYKDLISPIPKLETDSPQIAHKHLTLTIDFRDWKFLSNTQRFQATITDPEIINGEKDGEIEIDFSKMQTCDAAGASMFEVAGRVFYEAHVFGYKVSSFTSSGFLDREGYVIPEVTSSKLLFLQKNFTAIYIISLAAIFMIIAKQKGHNEKLKKL